MIRTIFVLFLFLFAASQPDPRPTLYITGDSTVRNRLPLVGWGDAIGQFFDPARILIENHAMAGRSSRTFISEGRWEAVRSHLRHGDFVLIQFGHNDTKSALTAARYTLSGIGNETEPATDPKTHEQILVHTFGWYLEKMVDETLAAGATPILLSPVPRSKWSAGKIVRGEAGHALWAEQVADSRHVPFIDINAIIADRYDPIGKTSIEKMFFPQDHTHTNAAGARISAACVVLGILQLKNCPLRDDLLPSAPTLAKAAATIEIPTTDPTPAPPTTAPTTQP
jgi:lysophospholipase L1-like esterase